MNAPAPRAVVVTGGAQGIGRAIAERFLADGASVVIADVDGDLAGDDGRRAGGRGPVRAVTCDVSSRDDVRAPCAPVPEQFGRLDAMIAHAGIADVKPLLEIDDRSWQRVLDVNLTGVFLCMQEAGRVMAQGEGGAIVVTASTNSFWVEQNMAAYNASKGGVVALVRTAALDLAPLGIRVNAVAPGVVRTRISAVGDRRSGARARVPQEAAARPLRRAGRRGQRGRVPGLAAVVVHHRPDADPRRRADAWVNRWTRWTSRFPERGNDCAAAGTGIHSRGEADVGV